MKCPHIEKCMQQVVKGSLPLCKGEYRFKTVEDFDKCFKEHSLDAEGKYSGLKRAEEWAK